MLRVLERHLMILVHSTMREGCEWGGPAGWERSVIIASRSSDSRSDNLLNRKVRDKDTSIAPDCSQNTSVHYERCERRVKCIITDVACSIQFHLREGTRYRVKCRMVNASHRDFTAYVVQTLLAWRLSKPFSTVLHNTAVPWHISQFI
jgi:hypothetical protein